MATTSKSSGTKPPKAKTGTPRATLPNTFTLSISASASLPALLGLDTLSLSIPAPTAATKPTSRIQITNIPTRRVHLLFASASLDTGIRSGFWIHIPENISGALVSYTWDRETEELSFLSDATSEAEDQKQGKTFEYATLLRLKSASASEDNGEWSSLTQHLTPLSLTRLIPHSTSTPIQTWPISTLSTTDFPNPDLTLTPISHIHTFPPSSTGRDRTTHSLDKSWYLSTLLEGLPEGHLDGEQPYGEPLLSEFSLVFLSASILGNSSAIQQWKDILNVSLRCKAAPAEKGKYTYFARLLRLLEVQLGYLNLLPTTNNEQEQDEESSAAALFFETESGLVELGELLFSFGQGLRGDSHSDVDADASAMEALSAVREAYMHLANVTSSSALEGRNGNGVLRWDLASALLPDTQRRAENGRLQRRILRGVEGFGSDESDDEEDEGPVVLDLDGLLDGDGDGDENENDEEGVEREV